MIKIPGMCHYCGNEAQYKTGSICVTCKNLQKLEKRFGVDIINRKRALTPCSGCGFKPRHMAQLEIDHVNGNNRDDSPQNLQLLCCNCHRIKTILCKDNLNRYPRNLGFT